MLTYSLVEIELYKIEPDEFCNHAKNITQIIIRMNYNEFEANTEVASDI